MTISPISKFPSVDREISFYIPKAIPYGDVRDCIKLSVQKNLFCIESKINLSKITCMDVYFGGQIPDNMKSFTILIQFESFKESLKNKEIDKIIDYIIRGLVESFKINMR